MSELSKLLKQYTDGDSDATMLVLELACYDDELNAAIHMWHQEHDNPEEIARIKAIIATEIKKHRTTQTDL